MRDYVVQQTLENGLIAIIRGMDENLILPLAEALYSGGVKMVEVTFNQSKPDTFESTARAIAVMRERLAGKIIPGAGTAFTPKQVELAAEAGAMYIVSPHTDADVIRKTRELGLVSMPGALTASEAAVAYNAGADFVKLFPAGSLGPGYLKALCAPLAHLRFLAVGGIDLNNAADFIRAGAVGLGVGGNLVNKEWIETGQFGKITDLAAKLNAVVQSALKKG
ncbi:MAG: bifunctional 4-hydroxy-2-oxoglutarate aldolase/2-dehydro-3-deoxy-phosphogluconate aldolase [Clostridiales bacterium]|jgi:2-dehydro-3-deoxyphosphogluconate aldolase/(4S)-4-hydroxy-2-oxoglutarate aldolase|nr:bifunctional 4-hydroxy-2-oxoglutarate aldolase/2-dehydro-3-deoxy-phosphogluconate aldolase [Clostridiales bacterium]